MSDSSDPQPSLAADPELLAGFFDETKEQLHGIADQLVALEQNPEDRQSVEAIFRAAHSIKGNSAFFGFLKAKHLAHRLENVLDAVRKQRLVPDREVISALLGGFDSLQAIFDRLRATQPEIEDVPVFDALLGALDAQEARSSSNNGPDWITIRKDVLAAEKSMELLPDDVRWSIQTLVRHLRKIDPEGGKGATADVPALKITAPSQGILGDLARILDPAIDGTLSEELSKQVLGLLEQVKAAATDDAAKAFGEEMLDGYRTFTEAMGFDPLLRDFLRERLPSAPAMPGFASLAVKVEKEPEKKAETAAAAPKEPANSHVAAPAAKTMRVGEERIDTFLHYVGELLVVADIFGHLQGQARAIAAGGGGQPAQRLARDLRRANDSFLTLSNKLQDAIMAVRKVPIRPLLHKVPRIVRDTAVAKGKDVQVVIHGDDIEIDKSLIDLLDAPLTHMSRNCADHGVETPDRREKAGKTPQGTVTVTVVETTATIVVTVADDGAGLDLDRIRAKAESLGIIKPGQHLGEQDLVSCIFAPGLSTAETVTDISGRGVGMDVVKRNIEEAGGTIVIRTERGIGASFAITLPKRATTRILPGYLVRQGGHLYVLPLERVRETFALSSKDEMSVAGRGRCLLRHDEIVPLTSLSDVLGSPSSHPTRRTVVTVESRRKRLAIETDGVVGVQKVVIRDIVGLGSAPGVLAGGALMGDGSVALVLDVDAMVTEYA